MFKKVIINSKKIIKFWIKAYIYTWLMLIIAIAAMSSYSPSLTYTVLVLFLVFIVFIVLEVKKALRIIKFIKEFEKSITDNLLKKYFKKLRWTLVFSSLLNIFPFNWIWTFLLKIYFYYTFNNLKNYLGMEDKNIEENLP